MMINHLQALTRGADEGAAGPRTGECQGRRRPCVSQGPVLAKAPC